MTAARPTTLITGATGGIGLALAQACQDHHLILQGRDPERLAALCAEFPAAQPLVLDLTQPATFAQALENVPAVTNVIHNAGVIELGAVGEQGHAVWTHALAVNVVAPAELTRLLLPQLRAERGQVVFINSGAGLSANPGWSSYAASKFALRALADSLRAEEASRGVRVTTIYPGRTATEMQRKVRGQEQAAYDASDYIRPESVAATARFVLDSPRDAALTDISVRPGPR